MNRNSAIVFDREPLTDNGGHSDRCANPLCRKEMSALNSRRFALIDTGWTCTYKAEWRAPGKSLKRHRWQKKRRRQRGTVDGAKLEEGRKLTGNLRLIQQGPRSQRHGGGQVTMETQQTPMYRRPIVYPISGFQRDCVSIHNGKTCSSGLFPLSWQLRRVHSLRVEPSHLDTDLVASIGSRLSIRPGILLSSAHQLVAAFVPHPQRFSSSHRCLCKVNYEQPR
jgi:hypothetical protein